MAVESNRRGPKLVKLLGPDLAPQHEFGDPFDFGDELANSVGNSWDFAVDREDNTYLCFLLQNRIEKYSPDGRLLWRADRELNYPAKMVEKGRMDGDRTFYPKFNSVASGLDSDDSGRIWVVTCDRQIRKDEEVIVMISGRVGGGETRKLSGNTDLRKTDMFKLEIFAPDGVLLGEIPLTHFVDMIRVHKDRLFLLDADRGVCFYEYKIVEK
jgi:sugar lactone lactonase YvrE